MRALPNIPGEHGGSFGEETRVVELVDFLSGLENHGAVRPGQDEIGVALVGGRGLALGRGGRAAHCPHVKAAGQLECRDDLRKIGGKFSVKEILRGCPIMVIMGRICT